MKWPTLTRQKRKHEDALLLANSRQGSCLHDRHGKEIGSDGTTSGAFGKSGATAPSSTPAHFNMLTPAITMRVPIVLLLAVSTSLRAVSPLITDDAETVDKRRVQLRLAGAYLQQAGTRQFTTPFNAIYGVSSNCEAGVTFGVQWDGAHPAAKSVGWMARSTHFPPSNTTGWMKHNRSSPSPRGPTLRCRPLPHTRSRHRQLRRGTFPHRHEDVGQVQLRLEPWLRPEQSVEALRRR